MELEFDGSSSGSRIQPGIQSIYPSLFLSCLNCPSCCPDWKITSFFLTHYQPVASSSPAIASKREKEKDNCRQPRELQLYIATIQPIVLPVKFNTIGAVGALCTYSIGARECMILLFRHWDGFHRCTLQNRNMNIATACKVLQLSSIARQLQYEYDQLIQLYLRTYAQLQLGQKAML